MWTKYWGLQTYKRISTVSKISDPYRFRLHRKSLFQTVSHFLCQDINIKEDLSYLYTSNGKKMCTNYL